MPNLIENRQIRAFISSTFRDMQGERDYLMKRTFPILRKLAAERDVTLTELDLRWGITEEEAESGKVVEICLREIENCIPFFIGIIGNRYGWVPKRDDLDQNVTERFKDVNNYLERHLSVTEMEMQFGVLQRKEHTHAYFYIKEGEDVANADNPEMLERLKKEVKASRYPTSTYSSPENLAEQVEQAFIALLDQLFPEGNISELEKERIGQRAFMNQLCLNYIRDERNFKALDDWLQDAENRQLVVTGASGLGKSALIANWLREKLQDEKRDYNIIYHFTGNGGSNSNKETIEKTLVNEINHIYGWNKEDLDSENNLRNAIERVQVYDDKPLLIVVDAINQILDKDNTKLLNWFPAANDKIKILFSTLEDDTTMEVFKYRHYPIFTLTPLDLERRKMLVKDYLHSYAKSLTEEQVCRIASDSQCENTLVLRTLLDELVNFGIFEELDTRIDYYLSQNTINDFYQKLLLSYETDYAEYDDHFVKHILSLIAISRNGLSEDEILQITDLKPLYWSQFYCAFSNHLINRNGLITFSHSFMRASVECRYIDNDPDWDSKCRLEVVNNIIESNTHRSWDELPYQYDKLDQDKPLYDLLTRIEVFSYLCSKEVYSVSYYWHKLLEHGYNLSDYKDILLQAQPSNKCYSQVISFIVQFFSFYKLGIELCDDYESYLHSPEYIKTENESLVKMYIWKGIINRSMSQYPAALQAFNSALSESIKDHGENHIVTSHALKHIGTIYNQLRQFDKAHDHYTKALHIQQELNCKKESIDTIHSIADNYLDWGQYVQAENQLFEALDKAITLLGKVNDTVSSLYNSIGALYDYLGKYDESIKYAKMNIEMDESIYGVYNINTAHGYFNMAGTYAKMGDFKQAESAYRKSIDIKTRLLGADNYDTQISLAGLGNILYNTGRFDEALECHLKYLHSYLQTIGDDDPYLAVIYSGVGNDYAGMEDYKNALIYHQKALEHIKQKEQTVPLPYYNQIGNDLYCLGEYEAAIEKYKECLHLAEEDNSPYNVSIVHNSIGRSYACLKQHEDALTHFQSALDIRKKILDKGDSRILQCEDNVKRIKSILSNNK